VILILLPPALAHEHDIKTPDPGFRPESEHTAAFLEALDTAAIAVYPTLLRRESRTASSFASQNQIVALLNKSGVLTVRAAPNRVDLGALRGSSQWEIFESDMQRIGESLQKWRSDARYHLFMEFLLPVSDQNIFGVHVYVLDAEGRNAFSFLLNSHHQPFVDARLVAENSSEAARESMIERATSLGVVALEAQIERARKPAADKPADTSSLSPGLQQGPSRISQLCSSAQSDEYLINELPMYGHRKKTPDQELADQRYIEMMTSGDRTRSEGAESAARLGWNAYYEGDCRLAIRRFNQAWLLDANNQLALWGFAVIALERDQLEEATRYLEMALESGPANPTLQADYEYVSKLR
jgi:hypothetical protein